LASGGTERLPADSAEVAFATKVAPGYNVQSRAGCTDIELRISAEDAAFPVFPTTRLHLEAAVDAALDPAR